VDAWLAATAEGRDPLASAERPSPEVLATELLGSGLRHLDGVAMAMLARQTGLVPAPASITRLVEGGVLRETAGVLTLTSAGFPVADSVAAHLAGNLAPARRDEASARVRG
jgi:coproporphyrinogen III oxidase-like Fe-S oxidoreductase